MQVDLQEELYARDEGSTMNEICINLVGEIATPISVTLTLATITATRKKPVQCMNKALVS